MKRSVIVLLFLLGLVLPEFAAAVRWGLPHYALLVVTLTAFCVAVVRYQLRLHAFVVVASSVASYLLAKAGFKLWMEDGYFQWRWLEFLAEKSGANGEGAYNLIQFEMFLASYFTILLALTVASLALKARRRAE